MPRRRHAAVACVLCCLCDPKKRQHGLVMIKLSLYEVMILPDATDRPLQKLSFFLSFFPFFLSFFPALPTDSVCCDELAPATNKKNWPLLKCFSLFLNYLHATEEVLPGRRPSAHESRAQRPDRGQHGPQVVHQPAAGIHDLQHILDLRRLQRDAAEHPGRLR